MARNGFVYFIEAPSVARIKIGWVKDDLRRRVALLQIGSPVPLVPIAFMEGTRADERRLHRRFKSSREAGEWFRDTPELRTFIRENACRYSPELMSWFRSRDALSRGGSRGRDARMIEAVLGIHRVRRQSGWRGLPIPPGQESGRGWLRDLSRPFWDRPTLFGPPERFQGEEE